MRAPFIDIRDSYTGLLFLAGLDGEGRQSLLEAVRQARAAGAPKSRAQLLETLVQNTGLPKRSLRAMFGLIEMILRPTIFGRRDRSDAIKSYVKDVEGQIEGVDPVELGEFLTALTKEEPVWASSSKITGLMTNHSRCYRSATVLTDLRPTFEGEGAPDKITAGLVTHTLMISSIGEEPSEFYVALDAADLTALRDKLTRAIQKAETLNNTLTPLNLPIIDE